MTKDQYKKYQDKVEDFFIKEGINNLSAGIQKCPSCYFDFTQDGLPDTVECGCGDTKQSLEEPYFTYRACDCCGTRLAGDRQMASGYNPIMDEVFEYEVCQDCLYYAEYGTLDDMTMMDMED